MPSYIVVRPMAQPLAAIKPRPTVSSAGVQAARRSLFGCCKSDDIDAKLEEANERNSAYLSQRYNFSLEQLVEKCNQQISVETATATTTSPTQFYIDSDSEKKNSNFPQLEKEPIFAVTHKNCIKRTFRVRKAHSGDSRVPKRKINQISSNKNNNNNNNNNNNTKADSHNSEMGTNGAKRMCNGWNNKNGNN